ncbi:MAG: SRPBCC family protein [Solirubrobacterales bacterium]|nr:SRPBCC family protein [Solirubrobacterales bacterium]
MKLEQSFSVEAPIERVWSALIDVEQVAPCLPGAEVTESDGETYHGTFTVKIGPTTAAYRGTLKMEALDEAARTATMSAKGTDKRGQGGATATVVSTLVEEGGATRVDVVTDFTITGRLARFGRGGMIEDVSRRLLKDFASCLQATLTAEPEVEAAAPVAEASPVPAAPADTGTEPVDADVLSAAASEEAATAAAAPTSAEQQAGGEELAEPTPAAAAPAMPEKAAAEAAAAGPEAPPRTGSIPPPGGQPTRPRPAPQPAKPINGIRLILGVLWDRLKRLFSRRPG